MSRPKNSDEAVPSGVSHKSGLPRVSPDIVEAQFPEEIDNVIPTRGYQMLPLVGLGGSAGSIGALREFFQAMQPDSGMAFAVVIHLSPTHESTIADLLGRSTRMRVVQAEDSIKVEANCVYVIPPGKQMTAINGHLRLSDLEHEHGKRVAIDLFFRSLADSHGPHAAAIVLSGADGDGALGIKRIKERGGLTIAQDPEEAEHSSMPRSAIATGMVDWVLPSGQMPERLLEYREREMRLQLPPEEGPQPAVPAPVGGVPDEATFREVLLFLRARTGRDFSYYKRATILRRISRRMQVNGVDHMAGYLSFLRTNPGESGALLKDLLISVTNFFRDREAFEALEKHIPELFEEKKSSDSVRVWAPACATGEEAYSLAMLLLEQVRALDHAPALQVFGCDLDEDAIQFARVGLYPETITADVSTERLRRFFVKEAHGYRVRREVREIVLFATHDLLKDAPFSKLDLISCRNLLIYLNHDAQARALDIFHFALNPEAALFLGSSESVDEESSLFSTVDKKYRIFRRKPAARVGFPVPGVSVTLARALEQHAHRDFGPVLPGAAFSRRAEVPIAGRGILSDEDRRVSRSELHFKLIEHFAPPSIIISKDHEILHVSETAGRFLQIAGGEPTANIVRLVQPTLRIELRAALFRAASTGQIAECSRIPAELPGGPALVDIRVFPEKELAPNCMLVIFESHAPAGGNEAEIPAAEPEPVARQLDLELEQMKSHLRETVEQYEGSTEELKASNEELQAMNEELRSATEELETSREELQSTNEELITVNAELKSKVEELGHANSDLQNLMASTAIATIFLDRDLRVMRFTPPAVPIFHLIPGDIGRPLSDLQNRLSYPGLPTDARRVLDHLIPVEREVREGDGRCFIARLLPYRTIEDRIAGVVVNFVEITERKKAEAALRQSEERLRLILNSARDFAILTTDEKGLVCTWNPGAEIISGYKAAEIIGQPAEIIFTPEDRAAGKARAEMEIARRDGGARDERWHLRKDGTRFWGSGVLSPLIMGDQITGFVKILRDLTEVRLAEQNRRDAEDRFRFLVETVKDYAIFMLDAEGRVTSWNEGAHQIKGYSEAEALGQHHSIFYPPGAIAANLPAREMAAAAAEGRSENESWRVRKGGELFWANEIMLPLRRQGDHVLIGFAKITRDLTDRKAMEDELAALLASEQTARRRAEAADCTKDVFLAMLSHELRTPLTPVLMATESLLRRNDLPQRAIDALQMILRNIEMEAHFIDDLLDLTRLSHGKLELARDTFDLHEAIRRAVEISEPDILSKKQHLTLELDARESVMNGDFSRVQQVFWNLLKNASKFTPDGGKIQLRTANSAGGIMAELSDSGIGIAAAVLPDLFQAFRQADESITRQFGGLGLGLAISKATVEALGGSIAAASAGPGQGTTLTVKLPLAAKSSPASNV